jgi:hypothetical protein
VRNHTDMHCTRYRREAIAGMQLQPSIRASRADDRYYLAILFCGQQHLSATARGTRTLPSAAAPPPMYAVHARPSIGALLLDIGPSNRGFAAIRTKKSSRRPPTTRKSPPLCAFVVLAVRCCHHDRLQPFPSQVGACLGLARRFSRFYGENTAANNKMRSTGARTAPVREPSIGNRQAAPAVRPGVLEGCRRSHDARARCVFVLNIIFLFYFILFIIYSCFFIIFLLFGWAMSRTGLACLNP